MKYAFWIATALACLVAGLVGYHHAMGQIPVAAMTRAEAAFTRRAGGVNTMLHMPLPSERSRTVVRPSPDQFYSACVFDLSDGPVRLFGTATLDSYWSLSFFAHNTDVFHVVNDRQLPGPDYSFVLVRAGDDIPALPDNSEIVISPSMTGIVLQRVFVDSEDRLADLDQRRRLAACEPA